MSRTLYAAIVGLLAGVTAVASAQTASFPFKGAATEDDVQIRAGAGRNYYSVGELSKGDIVTVHDNLYGWYKISPPDGSFSYISKEYVEKTSGPPPAEGEVTGDNVRVRAPSPAGPEESYRTHHLMSAGETVRIRGFRGNYYRIAPPEGARLFVSKQYIEKATPQQIAAAKDQQREKRRRDAQSQRTSSQQTTADETAEGDSDQFTIDFGGDNEQETDQPDEPASRDSTASDGDRSGTDPTQRDTEQSGRRTTSDPPARDPSTQQDGQTEIADILPGTSEDASADQAASSSSEAGEQEGQRPGATGTDQPTDRSQPTDRPGSVESGQTGQADGGGTAGTERDGVSVGSVNVPLPGPEQIRGDMEPARLTILSDGSIVHEDRVAAPPKRPDLFEDLAAENADRPLVLRASEGTKAERILSVMDELRAAGIDNLYFATTEQGQTDRAAAASAADQQTGPPATDGETSRADRAPSQQQADADQTDRQAGQREGADETGSAAQTPDRQKEQPQGPTLEQVERRYRRALEKPVTEQPLGKLRKQYRKLLDSGRLSSTDRALVEARIRIIEQRQEAVSSIQQIEKVQTETQERRKVEARQRAAAPKDYAAVGRLTTSTLYSGRDLPQLYRIVNPLSGLTLAYVRPAEGMDLRGKLGDYVGVIGERSYDQATKLNILKVTEADTLAPQQAPASAAPELSPDTDAAPQPEQAEGGDDSSAGSSSSDADSGETSGEGAE